MSSGALDLSGTWDGEFDYPDVPEAGPRTPFVATISERGGVISGTVIEPHELVEGTAHATILGQRIGRAVHFTKDYHEAGECYECTVVYQGTLSEDGETVSGSWHIDHWSGPFEMRRSAGAEAKAQSQREVEAAF